MNRWSPFALLVCVFALFGARPVRAADLPQASTPTLAITALHLDVQVQARVEEGHVLFQQDLRWSLPDGVGRVALDGVTLPLLFPSVGEPPVAVDRGIIPPTTQDVEIEAEGGVKVTRKQESLLLQGGVSAGKTEFVRVRFALPIRAGSQTLALSGHAAGRTWLTMAMVASPPVRITLATDRPGRLSRFEEGRERLVGASLAQALGPAEVARVTMSDLPTPARQPGRALAWFAGAIALTGLASLLARRGGKSAEQQT